MPSQFLRALAVAFRPRFEFLQDTMSLADGRARVLLRAQGVGILFAGDFVAFVNGAYVASLLIPTGRRVRFVFVTALGPFVKQISVPAMLRVGSTGLAGDSADDWSGTRVQWRAAAPRAQLERLRARTREQHLPSSSRLRDGMPRRQG